jgi:transcriptional regulator with XRE-family HTH domain
LRKARERAGLSQSSLARAAGIAPDAVSRIESGARANPGFSTVARLASALGLSLDALAEGSVNAHASSSQANDLRTREAVRKARRLLKQVDTILVNHPDP